MLHRWTIGALVLAAALGIADACAHDPARYPDWSGQWVIKGGNRWDPTKPPGIKQQAPLTPEYQAILEESIKDQAIGGIGNDPSTACMPVGMPRMMTLIFGMEFVITAGGHPHVVRGTPAAPHLHRRPRLAERDRSRPSAAIRSGAGATRTATAATDMLEIETRAIEGPPQFRADRDPAARGQPDCRQGAALPRQRQPRHPL